MLLQGNALKGDDVNKVKQKNDAKTLGAYTGNFQGNYADIDDANNGVDQTNNVKSNALASDTVQTNVATVDDATYVNQSNSATITP
jgi:hypothetical protein